MCAKEQTAGRGRTGNPWLSPEGGLYVTFAFPCSLENLKKHQNLPIRVGGVLAVQLRESFSLQVTLKWPNDVYLMGRKLAGILCESLPVDTDENFVLIGIGLNVFAVPSANATALAELPCQRRLADFRFGSEEQKCFIEALAAKLSAVFAPVPEVSESFQLDMETLRRSWSRPGFEIWQGDSGFAVTESWRENGMLLGPVPRFHQDSETLTPSPTLVTSGDHHYLPLALWPHAILRDEIRVWIVDQGNTSSKFYLVSRSANQEWAFGKALRISNDALPSLVADGSFHFGGPSLFFVASVSEKAKTTFLAVVQAHSSWKAILLPKRPSLVNLGRYPLAELGLDRLCLLEGLMRSPGLQVDCRYILVNSGTAITIDVIDGSGHYFGGWILPGFQAQTDSLSSHAPALPKLDWTSESIVAGNASLGWDTKSAIREGMAQAIILTVHGLQDSLVREMSGSCCKVVWLGRYPQGFLQSLKVPIQDQSLAARGLWSLVLG